ncbi:MAG: hypothetical protein ACK5LS_08290 [Propioniciclava sp.]
MTAWQALREAPRRLGQAAGQGRPRLRGLPRPPRRLSTRGFAVLMVGILVAGTVGLLFFSTFLQSQAFEVRQAQRQATELGYQVSDLEARVYAAQSPQELARRASELGMVPYENGVFIDLATGTVIGEAAPATGDELPELTVRTPVRAVSTTSDTEPVAEQTRTEQPDGAQPDGAQADVGQADAEPDEAPTADAADPAAEPETGETP